MSDGPGPTDFVTEGVSVPLSPQFPLVGVPEGRTLLTGTWGPLVGLPAEGSVTAGRAGGGEDLSCRL